MPVPGRVARPDLVTDVRAAGHGSCDRSFAAKSCQILAFPSSNRPLVEDQNFIGVRGATVVVTDGAIRRDFCLGQKQRGAK